MREIIKMVVVLTVLTAVSGGLLGGLRAMTKDRIEMQELKFVKGPVLEQLFANVENDIINDRFELPVGEEKKTFFPVKTGGDFSHVAFSTIGSGYGGDLGVMVAVNIKTGEISGVRITTHSETPGVGARAKNNPELLMPEFAGLEIDQSFAVKKAGGRIDAISGATITSKGVCGGVTRAGRIYSQNKDKIKEQLKRLNS